MSEAQAKVTAEDIRNALLAQYTAPEWYLGFEVGNSTGAYCRRHADAVAVNAYPSKGFETRGFEIKISKSDLQAEINNGLKADEIARYCDYWFLVTPKGLTSGFTLPPTWGVIEYSDGALRQKVPAQTLPKQPASIGFLVAMLRGRERIIEAHARKISEEAREQIRREALCGVKNAENELARIRGKLDKIKAETGIDLSEWVPPDRIIRRIKAANALDEIADQVHWVNREAGSIASSSAKIQAILEQIKAAEQEVPHD